MVIVIMLMIIGGPNSWQIMWFDLRVSPSGVFPKPMDMAPCHTYPASSSSSYPLFSSQSSLVAPLSSLLPIPILLPLSSSPSTSLLLMWTSTLMSRHHSNHTCCTVCKITWDHWFWVHVVSRGRLGQKPYDFWPWHSFRNVDFICLANSTALFILFYICFMFSYIFICLLDVFKRVAESIAPVSQNINKL